MKWSAVITTYNSEQVIGRALESLQALASSEKPVDIVVVDNASSDDTVSVIKSCGIAGDASGCSNHRAGHDR